MLLRVLRRALALLGRAPGEPDPLRAELIARRRTAIEVDA